MTVPEIISITVPTAILVFNILYQNSRDSKKNYDNRIEEKVDKDEYDKDLKATNARLKKCEDMTSILIDIKQKQSETSTDVKWIKEGFNNLHCKQ